MPEFLAKKNQDGSYSVSIPAGELVQYAFVDYYNEKTQTGFQRLESLTPTRGRDIARYIKRCAQADIKPRLFEMTANIRTNNVNFEPLDEEELLGFLKVKSKPDESWLSMIDGGTRLLGIQNALNEGLMDKKVAFDVRIFENLSLANEIALFLLINDKQKKVRTDLGLRIVQRLLDDNAMTPDETKNLESVVPDTDKWQFEATRISAILNEAEDSPWRGLIQMPGDKNTKPIKLQAMLSSLKDLLTSDLRTELDQREQRRELKTSQGLADRTDYVVQVLKNFWNAVREVCPDAHAEPNTTVLWGSIGASACHIALAKIALTILSEPQPSLSKSRMVEMVSQSDAADYNFWFTKKGKKKEDAYPREKGEATQKTGAANYVRLAKVLEMQWRSSLHNSKRSAVALA